jgi:hypothetical protein
MTLTNKFVIQGTYDIKKNVNKNGTARNILDLIIQFRTYPSIYDEIEAGFFPNRANYTLEKAVFHAAKGGHLELVKQFINHFDPNPWNNDINYNNVYNGYKFNEYGDSCAEPCKCENSKLFHESFIKPILKGAVYGSHIHIIEYIRDLTRYCGSWYREYEYCMEIAIDIHNLKIIDYYNEMDPDRINDYKRHFFGVAAKSGHLDLFNLYTDRPIHEMMSRKQYALEDTGYKASIEIADLLIKGGASGADYSIQKALMYAPKGYLEYIKFLTTNEAVYKNCDELLNFAAGNNRYEACKIFIENGATNAEEVIEYAIKKNKRDIVRTLININCKNFDKYLEIDAKFNNKWLQLDILAEYLYHC